MESKQNRTMEKRGKSNGKREGVEEKTKVTFLNWILSIFCSQDGLG